MAERNVSQQGKYNVNIGQAGDGLHIGNAIYPPVVPDINYRKSNEVCQNRVALEHYLETALAQLRQHGCLEFRENVTLGSYQLRYVAKEEDFEVPFWPVYLRGEACFSFSEFSSINLTTLRQFSGQALRWAKTQVTSGAARRAIYNTRIPAHFCFAIALVDDLDESTARAIHTANPLDHSLDLMWYEVPLVYELNRSQLHFYDQPSSFLENFKGEVVWKPLRKVVKELRIGGKL